MHFATRQIADSLNSSVHNHLLLNLERLLKAQGLLNLMNYAALQHIRSRLSAEYTVLKKTVGEENPDADMRLLQPVEEMGEQLSLLISLVLEATTLNTQEIESEYSRVLDCYTETDFPRRTGKESGIVNDVVAAYQWLLMQPLSLIHI